MKYAWALSFILSAVCLIKAAYEHGTDPVNTPAAWVALFAGMTAVSGLAAAGTNR